MDFERKYLESNKDLNEKSKNQELDYNDEIDKM